MKYGFVLTNANGRNIADLARTAEDSGWDGIFVGEAVWHIDPWVLLTAAAMVTRRVKLGTLICQLPRTKPWKIASETATLDNISGGRVIIGAGTGIWYYGYQAFKDETLDTKLRAELMDESIELLTLLFAGEPFNYSGNHYHVELTQLDKQYYPPRPVQQPRIPIWCVGMWPKTKSMDRAARCDGLLPEKKPPEGQPGELTPDDLCAMKDYIMARRDPTMPYDVVMQSSSLGMAPAQMAEKIAPWREAGATWWVEAPFDGSDEQVLAHLRQGPPQG